MNPALLIDGYKLDHRRQYPTGTTSLLQPVWEDGRFIQYYSFDEIGRGC